MVLLAVQVNRNQGHNSKGDLMNSKDNDMQVLKIKWQRLVSDGRTCRRCEVTEEELDKAVIALRQSLGSLNIQVSLEKVELSIAEFDEDPLQSNQIWLNDQLLEDWLGGKVNRSQCCDVCDPAECRVIEIGEETYEAIPAELIIRAGLLAASRMVIPETTGSCCDGETPEVTTTCCCQK